MNKDRLSPTAFHAFSHNSDKSTHLNRDSRKPFSRPLPLAEGRGRNADVYLNRIILEISHDAQTHSFSLE